MLQVTNYQHTDEAKRKIAEARTGKRHSARTRAKIGERRTERELEAALYRVASRHREEL
jgi:hypothetical protein